MTLRAHIVVARGSLSLDVWLSVAAGEVVALLGPVGAGKSSVLHCLAGLMAIDRGSIEHDGRTLDDPSTGTFVPAERRSVGVVFEQHLLFPHMSVLENVAFGLRARGVDRATARDDARRWLLRVGSNHDEYAKPDALAAGQAERAALARALAPEPTMLLLDEPLGALRGADRVEVRRDFRRHLTEFAGTAVLVTDDPVDAFTLADRVVVMEHGHVVQDGTFAEIAAHPRSAHVSDLVGINMLNGSTLGGVFALDGGATLVVAAEDLDGPAVAMIHPQAVSLHLSRPDGTTRNAWRATPIEIDDRGDRVRVRLEGPIQLVAEMTAGTADALRIRVGLHVWAAVRPTEIIVSLI